MSPIINPMEIVFCPADKGALRHANASAKPSATGKIAGGVLRHKETLLITGMLPHYYIFHN